MRNGEVHVILIFFNRRDKGGVSELEALHFIGGS